MGRVGVKSDTVSRRLLGDLLKGFF
jgi:hypothetical protein